MDIVIKELLDMIPEEQKNNVFDNSIDISFDFIGFIGQYKHLAQIIPRHFTVIDLGCGYNAQSFYFKDHKQYIAVDSFPDLICFKAPNCIFYNTTIKHFTSEILPKLNLDLEKVFAICSYVPNWDGQNINIVKNTFYNVYTYYPSIQ